ncbi:MAG: hypothetical protein GY868_21660, partial [Deltaproteobacteria bacterium]|nr:hypothetical protein [Deltaproteobacteria bacterium]
MPQPTTLATVCRRLTHLILTGICLVSLAACAAITSLYQGPKITTIIAPQQKTLPGTSLGVFDFSYTHPAIGSTLARAAHEQLLQNRFMHLIERPGISCKTDAEAIAAGRQRGYDVIMQTTIL